MTTHKILRASPRLKNLGPVSAAWLAGVGVMTRADLIRLGPVAAFLRVRDAGHKASMNLLWALAGAERGLRWNKLAEDDRQRLLIELDAAVAARSPDAIPAPVVVTPPAAVRPTLKATGKPAAKPAVKPGLKPALKKGSTKKAK